MYYLRDLSDSDDERPSSAHPSPSSDGIVGPPFLAPNYPLHPRPGMFPTASPKGLWPSPFMLGLQDGGTQRSRQPRMRGGLDLFDDTDGHSARYVLHRPVGRPNLAKFHLPTSSSEQLLIYNTKLSRDVVQFVKGLFNHTWLYDDNLGKDAINLRHSRLHVKLIKEVNNVTLLERYERKLSQMPNISLPDLPHMIRTTNFRRSHGQIMGINPQKEILLFHGTRLENIDRIAQEGMSLGHAKDGLYGRNIYFTDCCQKADQYSDDKFNRSSGDLAMILARVAIGNTQKHGVAPNIPHDSQIGGTATDGTKRFYEFMIRNDDQCYPAYVIIYKRI